MMRSGTPGQFATALRWAHVPVFTAIVAIVIFTRLRLRAGRAWLAWTICLLRALALILNFLVGPNLNYREIISLRPIAFLGEFVFIAEGVPNPLMLCGQLGTALLVLFLADAAACTWRRGDKGAAFTVGGSMLFLRTVWGSACPFVNRLSRNMGAISAEPTIRAAAQHSHFR